jgi:hypothetical protein
VSGTSEDRRRKVWPLLVATLPLVAFTTSHSHRSKVPVHAAVRAAPVDAAALGKVVGDISLPGEGHPLGVPSSYSFYNHAELDNPLPPPGMAAATAWGVIFEAAEGSPAVNTRVEVRNEQLHLWSKSRGAWVVYQATAAPAGSDFYDPDAGAYANRSYAANLRREADGGISVKMDHGTWFHFWPNRVAIPASDVGGLFTTFEARLIKDNPSGPDDTASARYVAAAGADWWANLTAPWPANRQVLYGRFGYVTASWRSFNGASWSPAQIVLHPPNLHLMG